MEFETVLITFLGGMALYNFALRKNLTAKLEAAEAQIQGLEAEIFRLQPMSIQLESELQKYRSQWFDIVISQESPNDRTAWKRGKYAKDMLEKVGNPNAEVVILLFGEEKNETWEDYLIRCKNEFLTRKRAKLENLKKTSPVAWCEAMNQDVQMSY